MNFKEILDIIKFMALEKRLKRNCLKETAKNFMEHALQTIEPILSEKAKELATSETILQLTFHGMPRRHDVLKDCLEADLLQPFKVYGVQNPLMIPLPHKCAMVQDLLAHFIRKH